MAKYEAKTKDDNCIFCEIAKGVIPASIYWQNEEFMAFLSMDPNTEGFSCIIPKKHYGSDVMKMPDEVLKRFIVAAKKVTAVLENYFADVGRVGVIMEGTGIDHAHIKLVPMHGTGYMKKGEWRQVLSGKEFWFPKYEGWISSGGGPKADREALKRLAEKIKKSII